MSDTTHTPTAAPDTTPPPPGGGTALRRVAGGVVRELLLPAAVLVGLLAIAVALIEGPPLQQFLYAVF